MMRSAILKSKYTYEKIAKTSYLLTGKNYRLVIDKLVTLPTVKPTSEVPQPQILRITLDEGFGKSRDSVTRLMRSVIKKLTNLDMIKSAVWSSEPSDYDFRFSIFNLQSSEQDSCPVCSVFRARSGFNHCSSFCNSEHRLRLSRQFEVVEVDAEELESSNWVRDDINRVKFMMKRLRNHSKKLPREEREIKMKELTSELAKLQTLIMEEK